MKALSEFIELRGVIDEAHRLLLDDPIIIKELIFDKAGRITLSKGNRPTAY